MIRVLLISHTCQSRTEGQPRAVQIARLGDIDLRVVIPDRWMHYGRWRAADRPADGTFAASIEKVRWPWVGPAQCFLHWYPSLGRILRELRPDVIDLWEEPWGLVSAQACRLRSRVLPTAKIVPETEQNIDKRLPFPFSRFRRNVLSQADYVIGRNRDALEVVRAHGYRGPAEVVPNAVDAELFRPMDRDECRRASGLDGFVVGYVGRTVEEKGLADLVDALRLCDPSVNLLFVGTGPFRGALEAHAMNAGLSERVRFIDGKPLAELPPLMNAMDVLALPSRTTKSWKEQFGRVLIEANACGTPVIGSSSGAIPEVVGDGGLVAEERNPPALAEAIMKLKCDPDLCRELGRAGRAQVEAKYTWKRVAERMRDVYLRCLGRS